MDFKYRVKGLVQKPFIIRGAFFAVGSEMDFYFSEKELAFVKQRVKVDKVVDLSQVEQTKAPEPVLANISKTESVAKTESKPKGVKTSGKKQTSGTSQRTNTNNI